MLRFADLPVALDDGWLRVPSEEALHFSLLHAHLQSLGHRHGDSMHTTACGR